MGDILLSTSSGGSDGTTVSVFRQFGHKKQFRAHLRRAMSVCLIIGGNSAGCSPILFRTYTRTRHLEQAVRTVVPADFHQHASITPYCVALFAEKQVVQRVETVGG